MTSKERKEIRYQRRHAQRIEKQESFSKLYDCFDFVFSYYHLYDSYKKCARNVGWKGSIQKFMNRLPYETYLTFVRLRNKTFHYDPFYEFDLIERGKLRHIKSCTVRERGVQRCLCDNALVPLITRSFIYDNGASQINKGYTFAIKRITAHLHRYFRKHGNEGYVLIFDFKGFFDHVSHEVVHRIIDKSIKDKDLRWIAKHFVSAFGDIGLGLGSQISQVLALASANELDHYIKEVLRIKGYGRYMDDGCLIHESKEYLMRCLEEMKKICARLHIILNEKKTKIFKLSRGFTWLKMRFYLTKTGRVIKKIARASVTRMRRKLKRLKPLFDRSVLTIDDVYASFQSWRAYARHFDAFRTIKSMTECYNTIYQQEVAV